jgi:hypothetical protein
MKKVSTTHILIFIQLPFPELQIKNVEVNPIIPDQFAITRAQNLSSFKFKNYISSEDVPNFENQMNAITSDPRKFKDGDDLFEITLEKMRRDRIYNVSK